MYGKLFASMYEGTLYGQWQGIVTLQQLVILADADGVVDMTPPAIAARTSIPLDIIEAGLKQLSEADRYSRTPVEDGRRIVLIDEDRPWGWRIVNYRYYRDLASREDKKEKDRQRIAEKRKENSIVAGCRNVSQSVADVAHTDTYTNTDKKKDIARGFAQFWAAYPKKADKKKARDIWKRRGLESRADELIADVEARKARHKPWLDGFVPNPTTYLNGERWEDDIDEKPSGSGGRVFESGAEARRRQLEEQLAAAEGVEAADGDVRGQILEGVWERAE